MIVKRLVLWFDDRLRASSFAHHTLSKVFPDHWSFMLGEIALYSFILLVLTGVFLSFFFEPSQSETVYMGSYLPLQGVQMSEAYNSVLIISFDIRAGMVMRQMHHWGAVVFVAAIVLHLARVFFTGAFRRPRELNWMIGLTLLLLALANGFSGYSLPDDLLSGTGLRIAYSSMLSIPVIGTWATFLIFGGEFPAPDMIRRLFVIHIFIVPASMGALIAAHLMILWRQKHTQFPGPGRTETNVVGSKFWPAYTIKTLGLFFGVAAVLASMGGLFQINPVWLYGPFIASTITSPAQPDWYFLWMDGALRLFPPWEVRTPWFMIANPFFPTILFTAVAMLLLYAWPFLEARASGDHAEHQLLDFPGHHPVRTALGVAGFTLYGVLTVAAANDVIAKQLRIPVIEFTQALQIVALALPVLAGSIVFWRLRLSQRRRLARPLPEPPPPPPVPAILQGASGQGVEES